MATESVPRTSLEALLAEPRHSRSSSISTLWRDGGSIVGSPSLLKETQRDGELDVLEALRVLAMSEAAEPDTIAEILEAAAPSPADAEPAIHSAAALVIGTPEVMRWISANPKHVAASPNWRVALPGLGGAVVSVPLAEEALGHLIAAKAKLPREFSRLVQLNPWFTRRFAIQFRRYNGGRRVRFQDRSATARAWSHARSLLGPQVPTPWRSTHGRGSGRAIDEYSHKFLVRYTGLVKRTYRDDPIPPVMAALFAVASAAEVANPPNPQAVAGWRVLPAEVERDALNLIGLGPSPGPGLDPEIKEDVNFPFKASQSMIPKISWR